jgi:protocatechuate 3,4-dioxygenase, alpha subunit
LSLEATASQTVGPFFLIGMNRIKKDDLGRRDVAGKQVSIKGRVLDGDGKPVPDAVLEVWQANSVGKYAHPEDKQDKPLTPGFNGFDRIPTDGDGAFLFTTVKPGAVPGPDGKEQAPHIVVSVFMRGLLRRLVTRIYFPGEASNAEDFVLNLVEPTRRGTLVAISSAGQGGAFEWNVVLQGAEETVFFDIGL